MSRYTAEELAAIRATQKAAAEAYDASPEGRQAAAQAATERRSDAFFSRNADDDPTGGQWH